MKAASSNCISWKKYELSCLPPTCYLLPDFISVEEEEELRNHVYSRRWKQLLNRRLQNYGGLPDAKGMIAETLPKFMQNLVDKVNDLDIFEENNKANHVLVNEYEGGQGIMPHLDGDIFAPVIATVSIMAHTVLDFYHVQEDEDKNDDNKMCKDKIECVTRSPVYSLYVPRRSLLVLRNDLYDKFMHGIEERTHDHLSHCVNFEKNARNENNGRESKEGDDDMEGNEEKLVKRGTRVSFTIRNVPKVAKIKLNNLIRL